MPPAFQQVGESRCFRQALGRIVRTLRRTQGHRLGLAIHRCCSWKSARHSKKRVVGKEVGNNPTDRGKPGTKKNILTDGSGIPLAVTICPANRHDNTQVAGLLDAIVVLRPETAQHMCADKGYDYDNTRDLLANRGYQVHIPIRGLDTPTPEPGDPDRHPARRWVVERCIAWLHKFRKILVRYERQAENYLGLIQFACCLILYRKLLT